jgi:hypothetical protein
VPWALFGGRVSLCLWALGWCGGMTQGCALTDFRGARFTVEFCVTLAGALAASSVGTPICSRRRSAGDGCGASALYTKV